MIDPHQRTESMWVLMIITDPPSPSLSPPGASLTGDFYFCYTDFYVHSCSKLYSACNWNQDLGMIQSAVRSLNYRFIVYQILHFSKTTTKKKEKKKKNQFEWPSHVQSIKKSQKAKFQEAMHWTFYNLTQGLNVYAPKCLQSKSEVLCIKAVNSCWRLCYKQELRVFHE